MNINVMTAFLSLSEQIKRSEGNGKGAFVVLSHRAMGDTDQCRPEAKPENEIPPNQTDAKKVRGFCPSFLTGGPRAIDRCHGGTLDGNEVILDGKFPRQRPQEPADLRKRVNAWGLRANGFVQTECTGRQPGF